MDKLQLPPASVKRLEDLDARIKEITTVIVRLERAGVNVDELRARVEAAENQRRGLIREFGPTGERRNTTA